MARKNKKHSILAKWWRRYEYKHTTIAIGLITVFVLLLDTAIVQALLDSVQGLGLLGIVITGLLFVSFFTAAPAVVLLVALSDDYSPLTIAFYAALGSAIGDWIILKLFEERVGYELIPLARKWRIMPFIRRLKSKKNRDRTVILGMLAIASPMPDEVGIGLMGLAHLPTVSLLIITFLLNAAGILVLVLAV